jgi:hypothetical protein
MNMHADQQSYDAYVGAAGRTADTQVIAFAVWVEMSEISRDGFMALARADALDRTAVPPPVVFVASNAAGTW